MNGVVGLFVSPDMNADGVRQVFLNQMVHSFKNNQGDIDHLVVMYEDPACEASAKRAVHWLGKAVGERNVTLLGRGAASDLNDFVHDHFGRRERYIGWYASDAVKETLNTSCRQKAA